MGRAHVSAAAALALLERAETTHQRADWRQAARALGAALVALQVAPPAPEPAQAPVAPPTSEEVDTYREERERLSAPRAGPSLIEFLAERGIRDPGGELRGRDLESWHRARPFRRRLVRPDGMSLEAAAEAAFEAGYFDHVPWSDMDRCPVTDDMLIAAIEREACGDFRRLYPRHDLREAG